MSLPMIVDAIGFVWAACAVVLVYPRTLYPYETTKTLAAVAGAWLVVGLCLATGRPLAVAPAPLTLCAALTAWWAVCAAKADRPDIAMPVAGRLALGLWAGLWLGQNQALLVVLVLAGLVDVAYCFGRLWLGWQIFGEQADRQNTNGLQGNANFFGLTHMLLFFAATHLGGWWWLAAGIELAAVYRSRCRSAMAGVAAGVLWYAVAGPFPVVVAGLAVAVMAAAFAVAVAKRGARSAYLRLGLWSALWPAIKRHLVFGLGHDNLKLSMPHLIRAARSAGTLFPSDWNCRRAHNDWIQAVADAGLVGAALWLALLALAVATAPGTALAAAVVAWSVAGLAMHPGYVISAQTVFAVLLGCLLCGSGAAPLQHAPELGMAWAVAGWLVVQPAGRLWLYRRQLQSAIDQNFTGLGRAMQIEPKDTMGNLMMAHAALQHNRAWEAKIFAGRAMAHFNGESMMHDVLKTEAAVLALSGATQLAGRILAEAAGYEGSEKKEA